MSDGQRDGETPLPIPPRPTCGRCFASTTAVRVHHCETHHVSLAGVPREEFEAHLAGQEDEIVNPDGITVLRDRRSARHPADGEDSEPKQ